MCTALKDAEGRRDATASRPKSADFADAGSARMAIAV
jgi:hypothetical protein